MTTALTGELGRFLNPDNTHSTERSITVTVDGRIINIPTLVKGQIDPRGLASGKEPTKQQIDIAVKRAMEREAAGSSLPNFNSIEEAVAAAGARSDQGISHSEIVKGVNMAGQPQVQGNTTNTLINQLSTRLATAPAPQVQIDPMENIINLIVGIMDDSQSAGDVMKTQSKINARNAMLRAQNAALANEATQGALDSLMNKRAASDVHKRAAQELGFAPGQQDRQARLGEAQIRQAGLEGDLAEKEIGAFESIEERAEKESGARVESVEASTELTREQVEEAAMRLNVLPEHLQQELRQSEASINAIRASTSLTSAQTSATVSNTARTEDLHIFAKTSAQLSLDISKGQLELINSDIKKAHELEGLDKLKAGVDIINAHLKTQVLDLDIKQQKMFTKNMAEAIDLIREAADEGVPGADIELNRLLSGQGFSQRFGEQPTQGDLSEFTSQHPAVTRLTAGGNIKIKDAEASVQGLSNDIVTNRYNAEQGNIGMMEYAMNEHMFIMISDLIKDGKHGQFPDGTIGIIQPEDRKKFRKKLINLVVSDEESFGELILEGGLQGIANRIALVTEGTYDNVIQELLKRDHQAHGKKGGTSFFRDLGIEQQKTFYEMLQGTPGKDRSRSRAGF